MSDDEDPSDEPRWKADSEAQLAEDLAIITRRIHRLGIYVVLATLLNFLILAIGLPALRVYSASGVTTLVISAYSSMTAVVVLMSLAWLDRLEKRGDAIFQELSDQIESEFGLGSTRRVRPTTRIALREFAKSTELPLIRGPHGPAVYALLNIALTSATVIFAAIY